LDAGASSGSHSMNYRMWKGSYDYNGTNWKDVAGDISKSLGGVDFSSMWSMLDMSAEQLEWIKTNYSGLWSKMDVISGGIWMILLSMGIPKMKSLNLSMNN
jgi:hypothetical protein